MEASPRSMPDVWCETHSWVGSGAGRHNEDWATVVPEDGYAVLVDGATGLTKANIVIGESDAAWFARELCEHLGTYLRDPDIPTIEALARAGREVAEAYHSLPGAERLARIDEPNGSMAVLRWQDTQVEATLLGDCTAVVILRDGSCQILHDNTLTLLDEQNYQRMLRFARERGTTMAEARKALNPWFIENRCKMNEPGGYWAADISCRGYAHALVHTYPRAEVSSLFACSDGYAAAVDMGVACDAGALATRVLAGEGPLVEQLLRDAEGEDAGCWRVPRSKPSDDATYVAVRLAP